MKTPLLRLKESRDKFSSSERNVADYILEHPQKVCNMSIQDLAKATFTSPSTIMRLTRALECSGYKEFKKSLIVELALDQGRFTDRKDSRVLKEDSAEDIIQKITLHNLQSIEDTRKLMDPQVLQECVDLIRNADNILFYGIGASYLAVKDAYLKFLRINKNCKCDEDWHAQLLSARNATPNDVAIVMSYSGHTTEMVTCMKELNLHHTPIIAITRCTDSPVSSLANYRLFTTSMEPVFRNGAMASRLSQLCIIDMLYAVFANQEYDYCLQQLSRTHIEKP